MTYYIDDERKWRISKSGYEIRTGWSDDKRVIAKYPGIAAGPDFNSKQFTEWLGNAEKICDLYNAQFDAKTPCDECKKLRDALNALSGNIHKIYGGRP